MRSGLTGWLLEDDWDVKVLVVDEPVKDRYRSRSSKRSPRG